MKSKRTTPEVGNVKQSVVEENLVKSTNEALVTVVCPKKKFHGAKSGESEDRVAYMLMSYTKMLALVKKR